MPLDRYWEGDCLTYLGGRLVLGSGRTWPHDFLFFVGFFSPAPGSGVDDVASRLPADCEALSLWQSSPCVDSGVIMSRGFMVDGRGELPKRLGYSPPGVDMNDSVGECSNLTLGSGVP